MSYHFISEIEHGLMWIMGIDDPPLAIAMEPDTLRVVLTWGDRCRSDIPREGRERTPAGGFAWYEAMADVMAAGAIFVREALPQAPPEKRPEMEKMARQMEEAAELGWAVAKKS